MQFRRILIPTDFSAFSLAAVEPAVTIARCTGATIDLLFVLEDLPSVPIVTFEHLPAGTAEQFYEESRTRAAESLEETMAERIPEELRGETRVRRGPAATGIILTAEELPADLVVMTTHGKSGLKRAVLGSVADKIVRDPRVPVLVIRPKSRKRK